MTIITEEMIDAATKAWEMHYDERRINDYPAQPWSDEQRDEMRAILEAAINLNKIEVECEITDRGFKHLKPIETDYGHEVRVYESSAAFGPCIWLSSERTQEKGLAEGFREDNAEERAHVHMTLEQAKQLHAQIGHLINNHYQNDGE